MTKDYSSMPEGKRARMCYQDFSHIAFRLIKYLCKYLIINSI